jgi:hypothetical protein
MNLFENYTGFDLSFLLGYAVIIPQGEVKIMNKTDHVIKLLHPYYSTEFSFC